MEDGFTLDDLFDEVGLGSNDHPPSTPSSKEDFVLRGIKWVQRQKRTVSKEEIQSWLDGISHSFLPTMQSNIVDEIAYNNKVATTFVAMDDKSAKEVIEKKYEPKVVVQPQIYSILDENPLYLLPVLSLRKYVI